MEKEVLKEYLDALLDKAVLAKKKKFEIDKRKIELFHILFEFYKDKEKFEKSEEMEPGLEDTLKKFRLVLKAEDMPFVEKWFECVKYIVDIVDKHKRKLKKDDAFINDIDEYRKVMKLTNETVTRIFHNVRHELRIAKRTSKKNYYKEFDDMNKLVRLERDAVKDISQELVNLEPALKDLILKLASMKIPGKAEYEKRHFNEFMCVYGAVIHLAVVSIPLAEKRIKKDLSLIADSIIKCHELIGKRKIKFSDYRIMHNIMRKIPVKVEKIKTEFNNNKINNQ